MDAVSRSLPEMLWESLEMFPPETQGRWGPCLSDPLREGSGGGCFCGLGQVQRMRQWLHLETEECGAPRASAQQEAMLPRRAEVPYGVCGKDDEEEDALENGEGVWRMDNPREQHITKGVASRRRRREPWGGQSGDVVGSSFAGGVIDDNEGFFVDGGEGVVVNSGTDAGLIKDEEFFLYLEADHLEVFFRVDDSDDGVRTDLE
ncbi:hypothetical protein NDU88_001765 [Pleurodeles waltl]|uniref:Uncharacterized protein n=1 Tax=Pleurodeles waltl TaxID=8319 RepID=A0AAV7R818_PLEWA|nr:hypothetical protein NDU88_001765 [Pleurodeles waltl]